MNSVKNIRVAVASEWSTNCHKHLSATRLHAHGSIIFEIDGSVENQFYFGNSINGIVVAEWHENKPI